MKGKTTFSDAVFSVRDFDEKFRYDGKDLGVTCEGEKTVF